MGTYRFCGCIPCFLRPREGCAFTHTPEEQHKRCEAPEASAAGTVGAGAVRDVPCPAVPSRASIPCWARRELGVLEQQSCISREERGEERRQPWCSAVMATRPGTPGSTASEHPSPHFVLGCAAAHWGDLSWEQDTAGSRAVGGGFMAGLCSPNRRGTKRVEGIAAHLWSATSSHHPSWPSPNAQNHLKPETANAGCSCS